MFRNGWTGCFVLLLGLALPPLAGAVPDGGKDAGAARPNVKTAIPDLSWQKRSDWIDVKTDVTPAAKGDGVADDTAALQAALDGMQSGTTIYLPAGAYRITRTLVLKTQVLKRGSDARMLGISLIGCGRTTKILWDGPAGTNAVMLWLKWGAAHTARYVGITWDGQGRASVGIEHQSSSFSTEVFHQHEAFLNFTGTGIRIHDDPASAEMLFENCLFEHCGEGVAYTSFNDYNNTFNGCEFRNCGTGIVDRHGNGYVRDCHFEGSTNSDLSSHSEHGSSIRRCTSAGSRMFLKYTSFVGPMTVQDCHVSGWKDTNGAVAFGPHTAPVIFLDNTFSQPPPGSGPALGSIGGGQKLVLSGNTAENNLPLYGGHPAKVYEVPAGKLTGSLLPGSQSFLTEEVCLPGKLFDAKQDCGARGDNKTDDTRAIQKTIDAAREHGKGAIAYLPKGEYVISNTLSIAGADYVVGGCGSMSCLKWHGASNGVMVLVHDPDHITLENLSVGWERCGPSHGADILQTSSGRPSFMTYDCVHAGGMYQHDPENRGIRFSGLSGGSTVLIRQINANMRFTDCAQARILVNVGYYCNTIVEGKDKRRQGMLGFMTRWSGEKPCTLYVKDNQNLVVSDYYSESAPNWISLQGSDDDPPGRVVIQGAKVDGGDEKNFTDLSQRFGCVPVDIRNYGGMVFIGHDEFHYLPRPSLISYTGKRPCDIILVADEWYSTTLDVKKTDAAKVFRIGCEVKGWDTVKDKPINNESEAFADCLEDDTLDKIALAFDDLRRLGRLDLELNHPGILLATQKGR